MAKDASMRATLNTAKKLTPKQRVLLKYPNAWAEEGLMSGDWWIFVRRGSEKLALCKARVPLLAWRKAAWLLERDDRANG